MIENLSSWRARLAFGLIQVLVSACANQGYTTAASASLPGANGLALGPDGKLYVASVAESSITKVDPDSGDILGKLTRVSGVEGPDDLVFGPDGTLYWTSIFTGHRTDRISSRSNIASRRSGYLN